MDISFASKLWQVFRAVITGALNELRSALDYIATLLMETIDTHTVLIYTSPAT
jgi:hypothetical protein